jgi:hypothetical protein
MSISQKEAVFTATMSVLAANNVTFTMEHTDIKSVMTPSMRAEIINKIQSMFGNGEVEFKVSASNEAKTQSVSELKKYVGGLVTNWFNRDTRLNGNVTTKVPTKTKENKSAVKDPELMELLSLKKAIEARPTSSSNAEEIAEIDRVIAAKTATVAKTPVVDPIVSSLPADLAELFA